MAKITSFIAGLENAPIAAPAAAAAPVAAQQSADQAPTPARPAPTGKAAQKKYAARERPNREFMYFIERPGPRQRVGQRRLQPRPGGSRTTGRT